MTAVYTTKTAKDGAGNSFNAAEQDQDGTGASIAGVHALRDSTGANVNPATSDLQTAANASLASIAANTAAGTAINGAAMPSGGGGALGWLSAIWSKLSGTLSVSAASLPLPIGAAQEAGGNLATIAANSASAATAAAQATGNASLATIASAQATAANQATGNGSLATIATNSGTQATAANQTTGNASLSNISTATGTQADTAYVSGSGSVIALLKGIFGKLSGTLAISAASLPLPALAAQDGTDMTGVSPPAGATGIRGWMSAAYSVLYGLQVTAGAPADTAYGGSGTGSQIALLKWIGAAIKGTLSISWAGLTVADGQTATGIAAVGKMLFNGTTYDRQRSGGVIGASLVSPYDNAVSAIAILAVTSNTGQNVILALSGFNGGVLSYSGTFAGVNGTVYLSYDGGTTYVVAPIMRNVASGATVSGGITGALSVATAFEFFAPGATHVKYLNTGWSSGTCNVRISPIVLMQHPNPNVTQGGGGTAAWLTQAKCASTGGIPSIAEVYGAVTPVSTTLKSTAGMIYALDLANNATSTWAYLHIFQSSPTLGTTSAYLTYAIPPNSARTINFGDMGLALTGIYCSISSAAPQNDNTAMAAANSAIVVFHYN